MHPLSDKDLDRLSREAAEQFDVDQSPSGWEHLEHRLNKELPPQKEKDRKRFLWIFFIFLLLSGSGLVWMLGNKNGNDTTVNSDSISGNQKKETNQPVSSSPESKTTENKKNEDGNTEGSIVKEKKTSTDNSIPSNSDLTVSSTPTSEKNKLSENKINTKPVVVKNESKQTNRSSTTRKKTKTTVIGAELASNHPSNKKTDPLTNNAGKKDADNVSSTVIPVPEKPIVQSNANSTATNKPTTQSTDKVTQPEPAVVNPSTASSDMKKATANPKNKNPWAISLLTGIDKTRINGTGDSQFGYNIGTQVSYNLSKRWSFITGFIYTKKFYSAQAEDFHPPKHYWTNYVTLNSLEGDCIMWDIPINVRYNISTKPTNTWFVSTGFSSYIMRNQGYTYYYLDSNYAPTQGDWETNLQQNEWFKIVNLSAGYERMLNKSWSIQAEPFVKVPLSGFGFGKMDMNSYGIFVGIKYKPVFNKTKTTPAAKIP